MFDPAKIRICGIAGWARDAVMTTANTLLQAGMHNRVPAPAQMKPMG